MCVCDHSLMLVATLAIKEVEAENANYDSNVMRNNLEQEFEPIPTKQSEGLTLANKIFRLVLLCIINFYIIAC